MPRGRPHEAREAWGASRGHMKRRVRWGRAGVDRVRVAAGRQSLLPPAVLVPLFQSGGKEEQIGVNGSHTERMDYMHSFVGIID